MQAYPTASAPSKLACWRERMLAAILRPDPERRLRRALVANNLVLVRELLEAGAFAVNDPLMTWKSANTLRPQIGRTLLHEAAYAGSFEMVELLLVHRADPSRKSSWNIAPMHMAAMAGQAHVVALLAAHGASVLDPFPCLSHYCEEDPYTPTSVQLLATAGVKEYVGDEHARYRAERDAAHMHAATPAADAALLSLSRPRL